ncbi:efflux RND transporter periplasmic adaptor subunit [Thalassotalea atypica]|uniref:efflux RND transporter periplasmic adaptor subunit n=1 Tax=Thalassotalea atypica TaxID=2054316 RepID=UPI0025741D62|nr:efflux RND transporter periplasmic adaptor subunit [Thalassotalea atypica]
MTVLSKNGALIVASILLSCQFSAYGLNTSPGAQAEQLSEVTHEHAENETHAHKETHQEEPHQEEKNTNDHDDEHESHKDHTDQHQEHQNANENHENVALVSLTQKQMQLANIKVQILNAQLMNEKLYAPGEVKANGYTSFLISPRVDSVVIKRHISLGQHVKKDQTLITLFSETVAQAQAEYRTFYADWQRVENLNDTILSEKQKSEAYTRYIAARAILLAYGLSQKDIATLVNNDNATLGRYYLKAGQNGVILNDDFQQGQRVNAGQALATIVDESELWVEANLAPNADVKLPLGGTATLTINGKNYPSRIIQQGHTIDPVTRTRIIRLSVKNNSHDLHAGMFGDVFFEANSQTKVITVPQTALMRGADGDWTIFVEQAPGKFVPTEVRLGRVFGSFQEILGIQPGLNVAIQGAFFIASEQAKSGFDPHNH